MKKLLVIILTLFTLSSYSQSKVGAEGDLEPTGNFPVVKNRNVKGGLHSVKTIVERDAILASFKDSGMIVYVDDSSIYYKLSNNLSTWSELIPTTGFSVRDFYKDSMQTMYAKKHVVSIDTLTGVITYNDSTTSTLSVGGNNMANADLIFNGDRVHNGNKFNMIMDSIKYFTILAPDNYNEFDGAKASLSISAEEGVNIVAGKDAANASVSLRTTALLRSDVLIGITAPIINIDADSIKPSLSNTTYLGTPTSRFKETNTKSLNTDSINGIRIADYLGGNIANTDLTLDSNRYLYGNSKNLFFQNFNMLKFNGFSVSMSTLKSGLFVSDNESYFVTADSVGVQLASEVMVIGAAKALYLKTGAYSEYFYNQYNEDTSQFNLLGIEKETGKIIRYTGGWPSGSSGGITLSQADSVAKKVVTDSAFVLTNGSGTTANGSAVDLGGTLNSDAVINNAGGSLKLIVTNSNATDGRVLLIDPVTGVYGIGDIDNYSNANKISINDVSSTIDIDSRGGTTTIGDVSGGGNGKKIGVSNTTGPFIITGNQGSGKVLTSDASGNADWQTPSGGSDSTKLDKSDSTLAARITQQAGWIAGNTTAINTKADKSVKQTHTSGTTVTISNATTWLIVNPASTLATLTITMPASPTDAQRIEINFGGTLTTGTVVTDITVAGNTGQSILQATTPSSLEAGEALSYRYNSTNLKWYRIN